MESEEYGVDGHGVGGIWGQWPQHFGDIGSLGMGSGGCGLGGCGVRGGTGWVGTELDGCRVGGHGVEGL